MTKYYRPYVYCERLLRLKGGLRRRAIIRAFVEMFRQALTASERRRLAAHARRGTPIMVGAAIDEDFTNTPSSLACKRGDLNGEFDAHSRLIKVGDYGYLMYHATENEVREAMRSCGTGPRKRPLVDSQWDIFNRPPDEPLIFFL